MKIAIGCDHAGYSLKAPVMEHLRERGLEILDCGTQSTDSCDYPVFGERVARAVVNREADLGIVICGTGIGISIACNKVKGARCACVSEPLSAAMSRRHNNANVLAFGSRVIGEEMAKLCVDAFLDNAFEAGRHERRVCQLNELEEKKYSSN